jgi:NADH dehydrogenase
VLPAFAQELSDYAHKELELLGVDVRFGRPVTSCAAEGVTIGDTLVPCRTIVWAAGVEASPAAKWLGIPADRAGRAIVDKDLRAPGKQDIFIIGDTAAVMRDNGSLVPGIAPAAKQQGSYVAKVIKAKLTGRPVPGPFRYRHQGSLATIGKSAAIIDFGWIKLRGWLAWWVWGLAHIYFLIGVRWRIAVAWSWLWIYLSRQHSARLITQKESSREE